MFIASVDGIFARRFDSTGNPLGDEFQVNTFTDGHQRDPVIGVDAAGNFTIAWIDNGRQSIKEHGLYFRSFNSSGSPLGDEVLADRDDFSIRPSDPAIAMNAIGDFVLTWQRSLDFSEADGGEFGFRIFGRRFDCNGVAQGDTFRVGDTLNGGFNPDVASLLTGAPFSPG